MKEPLQALEKVKRVEVPDQLYDKLILKIKQQNQVPLVRVRAAVVALAFIAAGSWYTLNSTSMNQDNLSVNALVEVPNNSLYGYE